MFMFGFSDSEHERITKHRYGNSLKIINYKPGIRGNHTRGICRCKCNYVTPGTFGRLQAAYGIFKYECMICCDLLKMREDDTKGGEILCQRLY